MRHTGAYGRRSLKRFGAVVVAVVTAAALSFGFLTAGSARADGDRVDAITTVADHIAYDASARVPAVESDVRGKIAQGTNTIPLKGMNGYSSALVRISVFKPDADARLLVSGAPALSVGAGHDASTTVLAPVSDGKITIESDHAVASRVEVLAAFASGTKVPGATNALARAASLQSGNITGEETRVGVLGLGGIPSTGVRAVYITLDAQLDRAGTVALAGQELSLPAGRSVVSTIALPNQEQGTVSLSSRDTSGSFSLYARGWVTGSEANLSASNVQGSFVPATDADWSGADAAPDKSGTLANPHVGDSDFSIVLAGADKADTRSFVNIGSTMHGRSAGLLVDAGQGAVPQMEVVRSHASRVPVSVRGGAVHVRTLPLGSVLGAPAQERATSSIGISSPTTGSTVKIADTGSVKLSGTIRSSSSVQSVVVKANGKKIGTAAVTYGADHVGWTFETASPRTQDVKYSVTEYSRDGGTAVADTTVHVVLPDADDVVVSSDTKVVNPDDADNPVLQVSTDSVTFKNQPDFGIGDVIVSGLGKQAPYGFIRRVTSMRDTGQEWVVDTKPAVLTDVFLQAKVDYDKPAISDGVTVTENTDADPDMQVIDEGESDVQIVDASTVDFDIHHSSDKNGTDTIAYKTQRNSNVSNAAMVTNALYGGKNVYATRLASASLDSSLTLGKEKAVKFERTYELDSSASKSKDFSKAKHAANKAKASAKADGKVALEFDAAAKLGAKLEVDISVSWSWFVPHGELKKFSASVYGETVATQTATAYGTTEASLSKDLFKLSLPTIYFTVGPVPVVVTTDAHFNFDAKVGAKAQLQSTTTWKQSFEKGYEYTKDHGWKPIDTSDPDAENGNPCWPAGLSAEASLSASVGLTPTAEMKIYDIAGPEINVKAEVAGKLDATSDASHAFKVSGTVDFTAGFSAELALEIPIVDFTLASKTFAEVSTTKRLLTFEPKPIDLNCPIGNDDSDKDNGGKDHQDDSGSSTVAITGTVVDASTGNPITDAKITLNPVSGHGLPQTVVTDESGEYTGHIAKGNYSVSTSADGYVSDSRLVTVNADGQVMNITLIRHTSSTTEYKAVLTWDEFPRDLDSHLIGSDGINEPYHVYYSSPDAYSPDSDKVIASLDHDDTTSYGPETVTFDVSSNGTYNYYVHNYSQDGNMNQSGAEVRLYKGNSLINTYRIPPTWSDNNRWPVFSIVNGVVQDPTGDDANV